MRRTREDVDEALAEALTKMTVYAQQLEAKNAALVKAAQNAVARCWTSAPGIDMPKRTRGIDCDDIDELAAALKLFEEP